MSSISEDYIRSVVDKVAPACNLSEWTYTLKEFTNIAQNYFGELIPISLRGKAGGKEVCIPLVLKLAPTDERYRVSGAMGSMFERETFVYTEVLEKFRELNRALSLSEYIAPRCYYVCSEHCKETIAMQDMSHEGYKPYTSTMFLDFEHIKLSIEALAKLHAFSFILKENDPNAYDAAIKVCVPLNEQTNRRFVEILQDRLDKAVGKFEGTEYVPLLKHLRLNCVEFVEALAKSAEQTCICHGDIWKENVLFKYEHNQPISACLIDYQTARVSSPAFDTLYLIASSTHSELRQKHFRQLIDLYYEEFSKVLKEAKLDSNNIYPRVSFERDLKTVGPAVFIIANTALWLASGLQQEGHVRSKKVLQSAEDWTAAETTYKSAVVAIIDDFRSFDCLCKCF